MADVEVLVDEVEVDDDTGIDVVGAGEPARTTNNLLNKRVLDEILLCTLLSDNWIKIIANLEETMSESPENVVKDTHQSNVDVHPDGNLHLGWYDFRETTWCQRLLKGVVIGDRALTSLSQRSHSSGSMLSSSGTSALDTLHRRLLRCM